MNTEATVSRMGVWPPSAGLQGQAPNHPMLKRLKSVTMRVGASIPRNGLGESVGLPRFRGQVSGLHRSECCGGAAEHCS